MRSILGFVISVLIGSFIAPAFVLGSAFTSYTYTYSGDKFTVAGPPAWTATVSISMSFSTPLKSNIPYQPVTPIAWTISNGQTTISSPDKGSRFSVSLSTDTSGTIATWNLGSINSTGLTIDTCFIPYQCSYDSTIQRSADGNTFIYTGQTNTTSTWQSDGGNQAPPTNLNRAGVLSHIAFGGGWGTDVTLVNTSTGPVSITLNFHGDDGNALTVPITVTQQGSIQSTTSSTVSTTLNANTTWLVSVGATPFYYQTNTVVGWIDVLSSGSIGGYAIFRSSPQTGSPSEGTATLQTQYPTTVTLPFDNAAGFAMGMALASMSLSPVTVTASIWDDNGVQLASQVFSMSANGHTSFTLPNQFPITVGKRGIIRFQSNSSSGLSGLG